MSHAKRLTAAACFLIPLVLTACGPSAPDPVQEETGPAVTMREIIDANRTETLLKQYGSVLLESAYEPQIDTSGLTVCAYADGKLYYDQTDTFQEIYTEDGVYLFTEGVYGAALLPGPADTSGFDYIALDPDLTAAETVTSVTDNGDTLTVTTVLPAAALKAYHEEHGGDYYVEGTHTGEEYVLNAADYRILSDTTTEYHADGTSDVVGTVTVTYGAPRPIRADALLERQQDPDRRTVTVVLDPGTADEQRLTVTAKRGDVVFPQLPDGYVALYEDPFCTQLFDGGADLNEDLTLYCQSLTRPAGTDSGGTFQ